MRRALEYLIRPRRGSRRAALEAMCFLVIAWVMVRMVPFRHWGRLLGPRVEGELPEHSMAMDAATRHVRWSVESVAHHLPWHSTCLMRALAGRLMLRRRGIASQIVLAARPASAGALEAHAWLTACDGIVLGESEAADYRPLAQFGEPRLSRRPGAKTLD